MKLVITFDYENTDESRKELKKAFADIEEFLRGKRLKAGSRLLIHHTKTRQEIGHAEIQSDVVK